MKKNSDAMITITKTIAVVVMVSLRDGHVTLATSWRTCRANSAGLVLAMVFIRPFKGARYGRGPRRRSAWRETLRTARRGRHERRRSWQEWRASNPQPPVLETGALPIELHS